MKRLKKGQGIAWLVAFVVILGLLGYYAAIVIMGTISKNDDSLKLGLDLDGGVSITYEAVGDTPTDEQMEDTILKLQHFWKSWVLLVHFILLHREIMMETKIILLEQAVMS